MLSRKVCNLLDKYVYEHSLKYHEAKALIERASLDFMLNWTDSYKSLKYDFDKSVTTLAELSNKTCKDVHLQIEKMYTQMQKEIQQNASD